MDALPTHPLHPLPLATTHPPRVQVKSHLQRHRTAYVADCLARGEVVDVSEAQLRASQALLEKRAAGGGSGGGGGAAGGDNARSAATSSRRRPASSMQRSDGSSPPPSQQRQRPRSDSAAAAPMDTDGGTCSGSAGRLPERQGSGWAAAAAAQGGATGRNAAAVRAAGSGDGCDTAVSGSEQASDPVPASNLAVDGRSGQPGSSAGAAAAPAAAAAASAPPLQGAPAAAPQQAGATDKLESLLARVQQLHAASELLVAQMQEQQRQQQRAWMAMQQALQTLQRECAVS